MEYMSLSEFRASGLLQELNRLYLHPRGLALDWEMDSSGGKFKIQDHRADPEGIVFEYGPNKVLADRAGAMLHRKAAARRRAFGWHIQPVGAPGVYLTNDQDRR